MPPKVAFVVGAFCCWPFSVPFDGLAFGTTFVNRWNAASSKLPWSVVNKSKLHIFHVHVVIHWSSRDTTLGRDIFVTIANASGHHWKLGNLSLGLWNLMTSISQRTKVVPMKIPPTRNRKGKVTVSNPSSSAGTIEKSSRPLLQQRISSAG